MFELYMFQVYWYIFKAELLAIKTIFTELHLLLWKLCLSHCGALLIGKICALCGEQILSLKNSPPCGKNSPTREANNSLLKLSSL